MLARVTAGSTYVFDGLGHDMSIGTAQGEVEHHDLIGGYESGDRHDKDQVPEEGERRPASISRLRLKTGPTLQKSTENTRSLTCRWEEQKAMSQGPFEQLGKGRQSEPARPRWTQSTFVPRLERRQQRLKGRDSARCLTPHLLESLNLYWIDLIITWVDKTNQERRDARLVSEI